MTRRRWKAEFVLTKIRLQAIELGVHLVSSTTCYEEEEDLTLYVLPYRVRHDSILSLIFDGSMQPQTPRDDGEASETCDVLVQATEVAQIRASGHIRASNKAGHVTGEIDEAFNVWLGGVQTAADTV